MKFNSALPLLALAGCLTFVQSVAASSPTISSLHVECKVVSAETRTVRVVMNWQMGLQPSMDYRFAFQNTGTGQVNTFYHDTMAGEQGVTGTFTFPLPQGSYNLAITYSNQDVPNAPALPGPAAYWNGIKVTATVSTHGRGTGCEFAGVANRANQIAPEVKPKTN